MDLSIVIPTYNLGKHISTTLNSLYLTQKGFEIIVVDDDSTDNTFSIIEKIRLLSIK